MGSSADLWWLQLGCPSLFCSLFYSISYLVSSASKVRNTVSDPSFIPQDGVHHYEKVPRQAGACDSTSLLMMSAIFPRDMFSLP